MTTPSPQSPPEPGRGDMLARQERMAELEREIDQGESSGAEHDEEGRARLAALRSEISRLRNEDGEDERGKALDAIRRQTIPSWLKSNTASPSDLPAREAIEGAAHKLEKVRRWFKGRLQGKAVGDPANALVDLDQAIAALQPLSQGNGEAVKWESRWLKPLGPWFEINKASYETRRLGDAYEYRALYAAPPSQPEGLDPRVTRMAAHCCVPELDEPFFVLLGRDPQAPGLVEKWAQDRAQVEPGDKAVSAFATAKFMRVWKDAHPERGLSMEAFARITPSDLPAREAIERALITYDNAADHYAYIVAANELAKAARAALQPLSQGNGGADPSLEPGADRRRDKVAKIIETYWESRKPEGVREAITWQYRRKMGNLWGKWEYCSADYAEWCKPQHDYESRIIYVPLRGLVEAAEVHSAEALEDAAIHLEARAFDLAEDYENPKLSEEVGDIAEELRERLRTLSAKGPLHFTTPTARGRL